MEAVDRLTRWMDAVDREWMDAVERRPRTGHDDGWIEKTWIEKTEDTMDG